jgi:hypothetical protein
VKNKDPLHSIAGSVVGYQQRYDAFISFRDEDIPYGFIDNLHGALAKRGINTFVDIKRYQKEQNHHTVSSKGYSRVQDCHCHLSRKYAFSPFCLEVLSSTVDNFQQNHKNRYIIPVYYDIDPCHVQMQSGPYQIAFAKHEVRFKGNKERVVDGGTRYLKCLSSMTMGFISNKGK